MVLEVLKGMVQPKMKIILWFTPHQAIQGVHDYPLSDKNNQNYI